MYNVNHIKQAPPLQLPSPVSIPKGVVTNYGKGGYLTGGGTSEVLPLQKEGGGP